MRVERVGGAWFDKPGESTSIRDETVVKVFANPVKAAQRAGRRLPNAPDLRSINGCEVTWEYAPGDPLYRHDDRVQSMFLDWAQENLWKDQFVDPFFARRFYRDKTRARCRQIEPDWDFKSAKQWNMMTPCSRNWHGDCCHENIVFNPATQTFHPIDWREDSYGDVYYDLGKFLRGLRFNMESLSALPYGEDFFWKWCFDNSYQAERVMLAYAHVLLGMGGLHRNKVGDILFHEGEKILCHYE